MGLIVTCTNDSKNNDDNNNSRNCKSVNFLTSIRNKIMMRIQENNEKKKSEALRREARHTTKSSEHNMATIKADLTP